MIDPLLALIVSDLRSTYGCHTVVLYGSRARGEHGAASDYDVVGIRPEGAEVHDARELAGAFLDAFIVSEHEAAQGGDDGVIRFRHGRVLVEQDGWGARLIARAGERFRAGPAALEATTDRTLRAWVAKMLARIEGAGPDDVEANHRRVWLLHELLEIYFKLRGRWYLGPKESLAWLRQNEPATAAAFSIALAPGPPPASLRTLVERVLAT